MSTTFGEHTLKQDILKALAGVADRHDASVLAFSTAVLEVLAFVQNSQVEVDKAYNEPEDSACLAFTRCGG